MKTIKRILVAVMSGLIINGCNTIHEYPNDTPNDPTIVNVDMTLTIKDIGFDISKRTKANETPSKEDYDVRYIIEVYPEGATKGAKTLIQRQVITKTSSESGKVNVKLNLNARKYTFLFWVDYVEKGTVRDLHYDTESLLAVKIKRPYTGSHDIKDAFTGVKTIDLTSYREQWNVVIKGNIDLKRPFAKLEILTTDIQKYINSKVKSTESSSIPAKVVFTYLPSIAEQYNVLTQKPERYSDSETFTAALSNFSDTECTIAFDYVFMNGESTNAAVRFDVYDQHDQLLNSVENLLIPIRRNVHTIIRDEFLTKEFKGGGVGIEDGFDGEIIITIPD